MKKDRYPNMGYMPASPNMNPNMMPNMMPNQGIMPFNNCMADDNINTSINQLQAQINMLDKRVTKLESMYCNNDNFNSNYHVM